MKRLPVHTSCIPGFLVLLLLLFAERLAAQGPGDYLISEGPFDYSLPSEIRYFYGYAGISLFDTRGREVRRFAVDVTDGMYSFPLDLSGLSSGPYEVRVRTHISLDSKRLVIRQE